MSESTEHVTVVPAELYDEMMADDAPGEPVAALREAAERKETVLRQLS
jgi:hypothetical protein